MHQLTLRLPDDLVDRLKLAARARGVSLNGWASMVLAAAVDPELAGDEASRLRERLASAGLLALPSPGRRRAPDPARVAAARAAAGRGQPLSDLVREGRG